MKYQIMNIEEKLLIDKYTLEQIQILNECGASFECGDGGIKCYNSISGIKDVTSFEYKARQNASMVV